MGVTGSLDALNQLAREYLDKHESEPTFHEVPIGRQPAASPTGLLPYLYQYGRYLGETLDDTEQANIIQDGLYGLTVIPRKDALFDFELNGSPQYPFVAASVIVDGLELTRQLTPHFRESPDENELAVDILVEQVYKPDMGQQLVKPTVRAGVPFSPDLRDSDDTQRQPQPTG